MKDRRKNVWIRATNNLKDVAEANKLQYTYAGHVARYHDYRSDDGPMNVLI